ncbi:MAG: hypothetical protein EBS19_14805, partial [Spirochaetia bacterium]|nr:hypothetical protein [Spirochaetia bacterium]
IEPYLYFQSAYGIYNRHWKFVNQTNLISISNYTLVQVGVTNNFNISLSPQFYYQQRANNSFAGLGDWPLELYFNLLTEDQAGNQPGLLLALKGNIPAGRYRNLAPIDFVTQAIGSGSWRPAISLTIGKQIHLGGYQFITARASFSVQFPNKIRVKGFNSYGGGFGTDGIITMGSQYTAVGAFEYEFSRHLVFSMDFQWQRNNKITFSGKKGLNPDGSIALIGLPSSDQLSISPAIEYNFNGNVGLIMGVWGTIAGRNALAFITPTVALNIEY